MPAPALESHSEPLEERSGPTAIPICDAVKIESAKPNTKLRSCKNPRYPTLLDIARKNKKDLELLFTILWSINAPPSLRALPRIARNLRRSLLILQLRYGIDLAAAGLAKWLEMLDWLASDPGVNELCYGRKRQVTRVLRHCASTHSFYALFWDAVGGGLACIRAYLAFLYIEQAPKRVTKEDYERHLREGSDVMLLAHSPYEAWHAFQNLLLSKSAWEYY
jgi:hypothetical protein